MVYEVLYFYKEHLAHVRATTLLKVGVARAQVTHVHTDFVQFLSSYEHCGRNYLLARYQFGCTVVISPERSISGRILGITWVKSVSCSAFTA